ncbi:alkyl hydroperoxide reductase subunit F, partial [Dermacoccus nishinomiyaensis]
QGRMTVEDFISKLDTGADAKAAAKLSEKEPFGVLVIGGGPAGVAAAIYTARKGIRTGLVAERIGGQVLDTNAIENFISMPYTEGPKLAAALEAHLHEYEIDVMKAQKVASITDEDGLKKVVTETGAELRAKQVIIATGARWRRMGVPGEEEYRNKGVTFCPHCDGPLFKGKSVAVIGGGNSGVEAAIDLAGVVGHVTVVEFLDTMRADDVLQRKLKSLPNVDIILSAATSEVVGDGKGVTGLTYTDRETNESKIIDVEGVFVQIGLLPNTEFLDGVVDLNERKEIVISDRGATSDPAIFAAGDVTTEPYKQIVVAEGSGATAALGAFDASIRG